MVDHKCCRKDCRLDQKPLFFIVGSQKSGTSWLKNCLKHCIRIDSPEWYYPELHALISSHMDKYGASQSVEARRSSAQHMAVAAWAELLREFDGDKSAYPNAPADWVRTDLFPQAVQQAKTHFRDGRVVVITRDPRATYNSLKHYLEFHEEGWSLRLDPLDFARNWTLHNSAWLSDEPDVHVRYEDLKTDFDREMATVLKGLALPHDADLVATIRGAEFDVGAHKAELPALYRTGTTDEWMSKLDPSEIAAIEEGAGELMARLGYPPF